MSEKTILLRAKMVFNLIFVLSEDFYLLYLFGLGRNSWVFICVQPQMKEKKREEEKGKERTKGLVDFTNFKLDSQVKYDDSKHF